MQDEILEKLIQRAVIVFKKDAAELSRATRFEEDLNAKSANIVQITTFLEDEYDIEIPYMDFKRKKTFAEAAELIEALIEG